MIVRSSMSVLSSVVLAFTAQALLTAPAGAAPGRPGPAAWSADRSWEPPMALGDYTRGSSFTVDRAGDTTAVWETSAGDVLSVRRSADGTWTAPELIGESGAGAAPQVEADREGNLTAVWVSRREGFTDGVMAATRAAGGAWTAPVRLSTDREVPSYPGDGLGAWGADDVDLAVSPSGAVVVVWDWGSDDRSQPWRIRAVYHRPGRAWGQVVGVTRAAGFRDPQAGIAADGTAVVQYARQPMGHSQELLSKTRRLGGDWSRAASLSRGGYGEQLAVDRAGDSVVAYLPGGGRVAAVYRRAGGRWGAPRRVSRDGVRVGDGFGLAMNGQGRILVVMGRSHGRVDLVQKPPRGPWSAPRQVVDSLVASDLVAVALNDAGDVFVTWGSYGLAGRYRPHGGRWGGPVTLSPDPGVDVLERVSARVASHGDVVVMWEQEELPLRMRVMTTP